MAWIWKLFSHSLRLVYLSGACVRRLSAWSNGIANQLMVDHQGPSVARPPASLRFTDCTDTERNIARCIKDCLMERASEPCEGYVESNEFADELVGVDGKVVTARDRDSADAKSETTGSDVLAGSIEQPIGERAEQVVATTADHQVVEPDVELVNSRDRCHGIESVDPRLSFDQQTCPNPSTKEIDERARFLYRFHHGQHDDVCSSLDHPIDLLLRPRIQSVDPHLKDSDRKNGAQSFDVLHRMVSDECSATVLAIRLPQEFKVNQAPVDARIDGPNCKVGIVADQDELNHKRGSQTIGIAGWSSGLRSSSGLSRRNATEFTCTISAGESLVLSKQCQTSAGMTTRRGSSVVI